MALFHVWPKATITGNVWDYVLNVYDPATKITYRHPHTVAAGLTVETRLDLLKISLDLSADATPQDIDDAFSLDDIRPGPQVETVWGNWLAAAEDVISGLAPGYTAESFTAAWTKQKTAAMRNDGRKAISNRGWTITGVHQHEGDGSSIDEAA